MATAELLIRPRSSTMVLEPIDLEVTPLSSRAWLLRVFTMCDYEQVIDLWLRTGIALGPTDSREGIRQTLQYNPDLFLVAYNGERVVGSVLGTYDGRWGWANHVSVDPQWQGVGVGAALMDELEKRLRARGCDTIHLTVARANGQVQGFYERLGFDARDAIVLQKSL